MLNIHQKLVLFKVFIFDFAVSLIFLDIVIFGLFLLMRMSQPTHIITGRWSEMSTLRISEWIYGLRLVDT